MAEILFEKEKEIKEVYQGTYPQDSITKSEEEIIDDILDEMRRNGVDISNSDELHITFEGAYDDGTSDTLMTIKLTLGSTVTFVLFEVTAVVFSVQLTVATFEKVPFVNNLTCTHTLALVPLAMCGIIQVTF
jgi:hypothetical protein